MTFQSALYRDATRTDAISDRIGTRFRPSQASSADALPYCVYTIIAQTPVYDATQTFALRSYLVQVDCYGTTALSARAVADAFVDRYSGYRGELYEGADGSAQVGESGVDCRRCYLRDYRDSAEQQNNANDQPVYVVQIDLEFHVGGTVTKAAPI